MFATNNVAMQITEKRRIFGGYIKQCRETAGISQEGAADIAEMDRQQWYRIETGRSGTKRETVIRMAKAVSADLNKALMLAGFASEGAAAVKKPTNVMEFFEILSDLGLDVQFSGGMKMLETLGEEDLQELLDGIVANASAKVKRKMQANQK